MQELHDESGGVENGCWEIDGHKILTVRTHVSMVAALILHRSFAPSIPLDFDIGECSVSTRIQIAGHIICVSAVYVPHAGIDRADPNKFWDGLHDVQAHTAQGQNEIILGDFNGWLGKSDGPSHCIKI
eukprot:711017-Amphidinium_carterae.1